MRPSRLLPMEGVITELRLGRSGLAVPAPPGGGPAEALGRSREAVFPLEDLLSGARTGITMSAHLVPDPLPGGVALTVLGPGDRRHVLTGGGFLADLPAGTRVSVPDTRYAALLRALHGSLVPEVGFGGDGHAIVPLWRDPAAEGRGEFLERGSWLPGPGEGITVLLRPCGSPASEPDDPLAAAVLAGERALAREFPGSLLSVRGQSFGGGIRFQALIVSPDGRRAVRGESQGSSDHPESVARELAGLLERRGARLIPVPDPG